MWDPGRVVNPDIFVRIFFAPWGGAMPPWTLDFGKGEALVRSEPESAYLYYYCIDLH